MNQWKHSLSVIGHLLKNSFPYSKWQLLVNYLRLLISAFILRSHYSKGDINKITLLGFSVYFRNRAELINLVEETFIYQVYGIRIEKRSPVIIDCGSHIGLSVLYFTHVFPNAKILCFEPDEDNFQLLKKNVEKNGLTNITVYNLALTDSEGNGILYRGDASINSSLFAREGTHAAKVNFRRLSSMLSTEVDILKLDVEGAEKTIIDDLILTGKIKLVNNIIMEYHPEITGAKPQEMMDLLARSGYRTIVIADTLHPGASELMIRSVKENG